MNVRISDLKIHEGLSIVKLDGFDGKPEYEGQVDEPGSANWLCERYGMSGDDYEGPGILFHDYDSWRGGTWDFTLLIDTEEVEALAAFAREAGYDVEGVEQVGEPIRFGDGGGTVEILRHRDGWVILDN